MPTSPGSRLATPLARVASRAGRVTAAAAAAGVGVGVGLAVGFAGAREVPLEIRSLPDAGGVLRNNLLVAALLVLGGAAAGAPTLVVLAINGFLLGAVAGGLFPVPGGAEFLARAVAPHAILELPALVLAGAVGLGVAARVGALLGAAVPAPPARALVEEALVALLLVLLGALVEGHVTSVLLDPYLAG